MATFDLMDNTTNSILNFFLDKSRSFGVKTALTISLIGLMFVVDFGLNISYNFSLNNRLSQLERIHKLKANYQKDTINFNHLLELEKEVINKKHYSDFLHFNTKAQKKVININTIDKNRINSKDVQYPPISTFWMVLSSSYGLLILMGVLLALPIFPNQKYEKNYFFGWLALNILWGSLIVLITLIAFQIPIIQNNPIYNYWLNFGIHTFFIFILLVIAKRNKKNT